MSEGAGAAARDLERVRALAAAVRDAGGRALVVGGYARDEALRRLGEQVESKDVDVEVYGLAFDELLPILGTVGRVDVVGAAFAVAKIAGTGIDVSIPRRESKVAPGHRGFAVSGDPEMEVAEAMRRRDFTVNALALDPLDGGIVDHHGGLDDLRARVLRATDLALFGDDPLRVLRAMQLAARLDMRLDPATAELCRRLDLGELPAERIGEEWSKLLLRAPRPSIGLRLGREVAVVQRLHPELDALRGTPQDGRTHPGGDVWTHTLLAVDAAAALLRERGPAADADRLIVMLATLCHDLGKPATARVREGGGGAVSGHPAAGVAPTARFLATLSVPGRPAAKVLKLVLHHLWPARAPTLDDHAVRRLARRLAPASIELLVAVATADHRARGARSHDFRRGAALLGRAGALGVASAPEPPIVRGRDLVALGLRPGPEYRRLLDFLGDAQERGRFRDVAGGLRLLEESGRLDALRGR